MTMLGARPVTAPGWTGQPTSDPSTGSGQALALIDDDPATTLPKLPERLHRRVFCENARELFGL